MATFPVPLKTPEAVAELASRQRKLSQRQRTVLLLVDGKRNEAQVRQMALQAGAAESCFGELVDMGMIGFAAEPEPAPSDVPAPPAFIEAIAAAASAPGPDTVAGGPDSVVSLLPASLTLQPESVLNDSVLNEPPASDLGELDSLIRDGQDDNLEEARELMIRAVRSEAPVAGSLTVLRLRRASSRADLEDLLGEVELRITKPFKGLWASQTMSRVKELLATQTVT